MEKATRIRYFDACKIGNDDPSKAAHLEFMHNGCISRKLEAAADAIHSRLNAFHRSIHFLRMIFYHLLDGPRPHLGYCYVTASKTSFDPSPMACGRYISHFLRKALRFGSFFEDIDMCYSRMYFAIKL